MNNQPIDWNWQFKEKDKPGDGVKETHSASFPMLFREQGMQRRVADQTENQKRPSKSEPRQLRPALVGTPQSPTRYGSSPDKIKKARHTRNVRLRCHPLPSPVDDLQRYASYQKFRT
jgi:hypothetical protein